MGFFDVFKIVLYVVGSVSPPPPDAEGSAVLR